MTSSLNTMRIRLTDERRDAILTSLTKFYADEFDEDLSVFRAEQILDFFVRAVGPPIYNQAIQDARSFMLDRLEDLDAQYYQDEGTAGPPVEDHR